MKTFTVTVAILGAWLTVLSQVGDGRMQVVDVPAAILSTPPSATGVLSSSSAPIGVSSSLSAPAGISALSSGIPSSSFAASPELTEVVQEYCVRCHNERRLTGNLTLEAFDVSAAHQQAAIAEKMIVKLRAGMMPPPGARRPSADTLLALVESLESVVDEAAAAAPNPGVRRFQRMNRAEYERVIHDLLDLEVDAGRWLPADTYLGNFDNLSAAQGLSTTLLEAYLRAATEVSRLAVGNPNAPRVSTKYTNPIEVSQHAWDHLEGTPYGTRGGMVVTHDFPADCQYVISVETLFGSGTGSEDLDISVDGEPLTQLRLEHNAAGNVPIRSEPVFIRAGQHRIAAAFVRRIEGPYEDRLSPHDWSFVGGEDERAWADYGITGLPHLADLMITGPIEPTGVSETPSRARIFTCHPQTPSEERPCAESIVERIATAAYRRPVDEDDLAGPMSFYDRAAAENGFEVGVRTALQAILASPSFLFRLERQPEGVEAGESYRLSDLELASRLSFFLWGTGPDDELVRLADEGRLFENGTLERQVERMLDDPRSEALATRFASQWLRLQDARKNAPDPFFYPDFTGQLGDDMVRETELFFHDLVRRDRSLLELFTADYTFVNERLAAHYGMPDVDGSDFRRVTYPEPNRRGLLGHGSVLLLTSMSDRTSPVLRGKWVMEVLMGSPPPPPPPNVPAFDETEGADGTRRLTTRERMEIHRANPTCNSCHRFMDPIGLALDNFDVTGRWRIRENGMPLDTRGTFYDGSDVSTPAELHDVLMKRPIPLVRNFTQNLLAYAIGRRVEYFDQPSVRTIVRDAEAQDYRMSSFILGVIRSAPFTMMQSTATADAGADEGA